MLTEIRKNAAYRYTTWWADVRRGSEEEVEGTTRRPTTTTTAAHQKALGARTLTHPKIFSFNFDFHNFTFFCSACILITDLHAIYDRLPLLLCAAKRLGGVLTLVPMGLSSAGWPIRLESSRKDRASRGGTLTRPGVGESKRRLKRRAEKKAPAKLICVSVWKFVADLWLYY